MHQGSLADISEVPFGPKYEFTPGVDLMGKRNSVGSAVSHVWDAVSHVWDAVFHAQTRAPRAPAPAWQDRVILRQVCPWQCAVQAFQRCHHKPLSNYWQLGSNCSLGSSTTGRNSRNRRVLCVLPISAKTELGATRQELVLLSIKMVRFCLF